MSRRRTRTPRGLLAGAAAALLLDTAGLALPAAVAVAVVVAFTIFGLHMLWMYHRGRPVMT